MMLLDSEQRHQATDPSLSFIVQAPAGSGKTEILTQRYLRLLRTVTAPEQIVAITFTRKAASEMRARILLALHHAAQNKEAHSPHQHMTLDFARDALKHDAFHQWDLLQQPNRLKIITIDSLCQSINQAIPLLEKQIAYPNITDKAESHYMNAGRECIQFALTTPKYQEAIKTLLLHVDNRHDRLLDLFKTLLSQREQWLVPLFQARAQEKSTFEQALKFITSHELNCFKQSLPVPLAQKLLQCVREFSMIENDPNSPRDVLKGWHDFQQINQAIARGLSQLLLTGSGTIRKSFDHHVGLHKSSCAPNEYKRLKNASKELLTELEGAPDFLAALIQISTLPAPEYDPQQWDVLQALFLLLPILVGHLHVLFSEHNEVDFTAISQQALNALGDAENPTDITLYLDNALHHILIDEFQDTSISQFDLLTQLVLGWQEGDGKTLFIVGDPMQSIYRFRQAEVGLFFRAKEQGIGPIRLQALELRCNFRSSQTLVDWVNHQFSTLFPKHVDIESGAVSFHPSIHVIQNKEHSSIHAIQCKNRQEEAQKLIEIIAEELHAKPKQDMAILVRSRTQLSDIIRLLRENQIPYQGIDITLLAHLSHLRDVWSLTQALLSPANRLSWFAVLHSPYCGLSLSDLHIIAQFNRQQSIYFALMHLHQIQGLSAEGRIRAEFFIRIIHKALSQRYASKLSTWVIRTLKELHLDHILNSNQLNDLEQFWTLLDRYEHAGRLPVQEEFLRQFTHLYSQRTTPSRLHIMTIHKSKGLEFDTVFLPGLGTPSNRKEDPMLRWLNLPTQKQGNLLLMSPLQAAHREPCALYEYLGQLDEVKSRYERQRLLYVAVTRAKSRLYLLDHTEKSSKNSLRSLLTRQEFITHEPLRNHSKEAGSNLPKLTRLPLRYYQSVETNACEVPSFPLTSLPSLLSSSIPRLTGIATHQLLHWICEKHPTHTTEIPWSMVRTTLRTLGFDEHMQDHALVTIEKQITGMFHDPIGSWIIAKHPEEHNEYELLIKQHNKSITRIIDRTFEDQGKCWIIDFKTGQEDEATLLKHQHQLNEYASYLAHRSPLPIHCGIYYLSQNHWHHWSV